jgi:glutamate synthase (NADPH/NADH) small chain
MTADRPNIDTLFSDLHPSLSSQATVVEANRCLNCFDAPCTAACPTHIDVPGFIGKIARGNLRGSALRILDANILGLSCSRVCPVDVLCEGSCVMHGRGERPIAIGLLQRHAMERFYESGARMTLSARPQSTQRVACVGGGPASLACAAELRRLGYQVTIFESRAAAGGLNTFGVAEYKLNAADSRREVEFVRSLGVAIETGAAVGENISLEELGSNYAAIFIGIGLGAGFSLEINDDGMHRIDALSFIEAYKKREPVPVGRQVIVIGGGNTAIDAACAARRLGAEEVTLAYRRREREMPAFAFEIAHARAEGVNLLFQVEPFAVHAGAAAARRSAGDAHEGSIEFRRTRLAEPDAAGRPAIEPDFGTEFTVPCDMLITAIGQSKLLDLLERFESVEIRDGRVAIDPATGRTSNSRYFAGGDCVSGGREVVDAVADGKRAARGIAAMLSPESARG